MIRNRWREIALCLFGCLILTSCSKPSQAGEVLDEAKQDGRDGASFTQASEDYFHDMDGALALTQQEVAVRNMWLIWSGGNGRFWTKMTDHTIGAFDLLKIVSWHPSQGYSRTDRWDYFGMVNEPCFEKCDEPRQRSPRPATGCAGQGLRG